MKSTVTAIIFSILPSLVFAGGGNNYAVITAVHPIYEDRYVTRYETQCYDVQVPVYGQQRSGSSDDILSGAIIGGAIGNQFGNGSGKDAMTALGIILGANRGSRSTREVITGYRLERQCDQVAREVLEPVISYYKVRYEYNGVEYHEQTTQRYTLGQRVRVTTNLR